MAACEPFLEIIFVFCSLEDTAGASQLGGGSRDAALNTCLPVGTHPCFITVEVFLVGFTKLCTGCLAGQCFCNILLSQGCQRSLLAQEAGTLLSPLPGCGQGDVCHSHVAVRLSAAWGCCDVLSGYLVCHSVAVL